MALSAETPIRVPEPDTLTLVFAAAAAGVLVWRIRRKKYELLPEPWRQRTPRRRSGPSPAMMDTNIERALAVAFYVPLVVAMVLETIAPRRAAIRSTAWRWLNTAGLAVIDTAGFRRVQPPS